MSIKHIILTDDHVIIRNGLKELIEKIGSYQISHEFDTGEELLKALPNCLPLPDLLILDINMPGLNGIETMERLNNLPEKIPVLALTLNDQEETIVKLFRLGVRGFLLKTCTAQDLKLALSEIFEKGYHHNAYLSFSLRQFNPPAQNPELEKINTLSPREKEFLQLVCDKNEYTYKVIASMMGVSERTVDGYREAVFEKLNIRSKSGLVMYLLQHQLLDKL